MATEKVTYELSLRDLMTGGLNDINKKLGALEGKLGSVEKNGVKSSNSLKNALSGIGTAIASIGIGALAINTIKLSAKFQSLSNAITFASDSATQGQLSMNWISSMSKKYGLEIESVTEGFKTFQGAMMKTKFTSGQVRKMFEQVSTGTVAMGLDAENAKGVFLALGQIMGKGKVQAEELRGQIGERVPGAFSIAARAMNMTTAELDKFMSDGKLLAEDFLPKFAAEMEKTFGQGAVNNSDSLTASMNRLSNSWTELRLAFAESDGGLVQKTFDGWAKTLDWIADKFRDINQLSAKASNENTMNILADVEQRMEKKRTKLAASGLDKNAIAEKLQWETKVYQNSWEEQIRIQEKQLKAIEDKKIAKDGKATVFQQLMGEKYDDREALYRDNEEYKKLYDNLTSLRNAYKGLQGISDKQVDILYKDKGATIGGASANKSKSTTKSEIDSIRGKAPSNTYINIDSLIKDVKMYPYEMGKTATNDLQSFLNQLESALITVVNDVNRIQN